MNKKLLPPVRILLIIFVFGLYIKFTKTIFNLYSADVRAARSKRLLLEADYENSLRLAKEAVSLNPSEPYYYRLRAQSYLMNSLFLEKEAKNTLKELALADLKYSERLNPKNLATLRNNIPFYYYLSLDDFSSVSEDAAFDEVCVEKTIEHLNYLKTTYPTDVGVLVSVSHYEKLLNLDERYKETLFRIRELRPDLLNWHPSLTFY